MHLARKLIATAVASATLALGVVAACTPRAEQERSPNGSAAAATPVARGASGAVATVAGPLPTMTVYKSPTCGCCKAWVQRAEAAGFRVVAHDTADVAPIKRQYGVADALHSCHTAVVGGYVVEGHVPPEDVIRLLRERPAIAGIAVPGMPVGSPGMEMGAQKDPYDVIAFTKEGRTSVYAKH